MKLINCYTSLLKFINTTKKASNFISQLKKLNITILHLVQNKNGIFLTRRKFIRYSQHHTIAPLSAIVLIRTTVVVISILKYWI